MARSNGPPFQSNDDAIPLNIISVVPLWVIPQVQNCQLNSIRNIMWMKCWSQNLNHGWYSLHVPTICGLFWISYIHFGDGASLVGLHNSFDFSMFNFFCIYVMTWFIGPYFTNFQWKDYCLGLLVIPLVVDCMEVK